MKTGDFINLWENEGSAVIRVGTPHKDIRTKFPYRFRYSSAVVGTPWYKNFQD
jgi:hypothetical protein